MTPEITEAAIRVLNRALKSDPNAIHTLICNRVPCNQVLADDPTIIAGANKLPVAGHPIGSLFRVDVLGLINGILGEIGCQPVALQFSDSPVEQGRLELMGFCHCDLRPENATNP